MLKLKKSNEKRKCEKIFPEWAFLSPSWFIRLKLKDRAQGSNARCNMTVASYSLGDFSLLIFQKLTK